MVLAGIDRIRTAATIPARVGALQPAFLEEAR